jgi:hypothetical protein
MPASYTITLDIDASGAITNLSQVSASLQQIGTIGPQQVQKLIQQFDQLATSIQNTQKQTATLASSLAGGFGAGLQLAEQIDLVGRLNDVILALVGTLENQLVKAWEEGLKADTITRNLAVFTGSIKDAQAAYEEFYQIARSSKFEIPQLAQAYEQLQQFRRAGIDAGQVFKDMTVLAAGPTGSLEALVSAFTRMESGLGRSNLAMRAFRSSGIDLAQILHSSLGISMDEVTAKLSKGEISVTQIAAAMHKAAAEGSYYAQVNKFLGEGATSQLKTLSDDWNHFLEQIFTPTISSGVIAKLFQDADNVLQQMIPHATAIGEEISKLSQAFLKIAEDKGWQTALAVAWQLAVDEMATITVTILTELFVKLGPALAHAFMIGFVGEMKYEFTGGAFRDLWEGNVGAAIWGSAGGKAAEAFAKDFGNTLLGSINVDADKARQILADALKGITPVGAGGTTPVPQRPAAPPLGADPAAQTRAINEQLKEQALLLQQIKFEAQLISQNPFLSPDQKEVLTLQNTTKEMAAIGEAIQKDNDLIDKGIGDPATYERVHAEVIKLSQAWDLLKLKQEAAMEPFRAEMMKWADSFGTVTHQIVDGIKGIEQALSSGLVDALTAVMNGTKSVGQAFKDMALQVVQAIEKIVLNLLIQLAVQQAIKAAFGTSIPITGLSGGGQVPTGGYGAYQFGGGTSNMMSSAAGSFQTGGPIPGHGSGDHVPILGEPGEYMINKESAKRFGYGNLERINKMQGGGRVGADGWMRMQGGGWVGIPEGQWGIANNLYGEAIDNGFTDTGARFLVERAYMESSFNAGEHDEAGSYGLMQTGVDIRGMSRDQQFAWFMNHMPAGMRDQINSSSSVMDAFNRVHKYPNWQTGSAARWRNTFGRGRGSDGGQRDRSTTRGDRFPMHYFNTLADFEPGGKLWESGPTGMSGPGAVPSNITSWVDETGRIHVNAGPGANVPTDEFGQPIGPNAYGGTGGIPNTTGVGSPENPSFVGSTPFGTSSNQPSGFDRAGNPVYGGQAPGFNIPGGIGLPGLGAGSHGDIGWYADFTLRQMAEAVNRGRRPWNFEYGGWMRGVLPLNRWGGAPFSLYSGRVKGSHPGSGEAHGARFGPNARIMQTFHQGGIIDAFSAMQSGGMVASGEGVFTPGQMANLQPAAGGGNFSQVNISITNNQGQSSTSSSVSGNGLNESDARAISRMVQGMVDARIAQQKRAGGQLYQPRGGG